jgi:hypothetical protein
VGCKWIFRTKWNSNSYIDRHKSCNKLKIGRFTVLPPANWSVHLYVVSIDALFINQKDAIFGTILEANFMYNHQGRIHGKSPYLLETKIVGKSYGSFVTHSRSMGLLHIMHLPSFGEFSNPIWFHSYYNLFYDINESAKWKNNPFYGLCLSRNHRWCWCDSFILSRNQLLLRFW